MRTEENFRDIQPGGVCNRLGGVSDKNLVHPNLSLVLLYAVSHQDSSEVAAMRLPMFGSVSQRAFF